MRIKSGSNALTIVRVVYTVGMARNRAPVLLMDPSLDLLRLDNSTWQSFTRYQRWGSHSRWFELCLHACMQATKLATQDGKEEVRTYYGIVCNLLIGKFDQGLHCPPMAQGLGKISQFKDVVCMLSSSMMPVSSHNASLVESVVGQQDGL